MSSLAARTREAAREHPFLVTALAAGVVNYAAAARFLDVEGDPEAVGTALSRYADELELDERSRRAPVTMRSGVAVADREGLATGDADPLLAVGDVAVTTDGGQHTALLATGEVDPAALATVLQRLVTSGIDPVAAGVGDEGLVVVVPGGDGPDALRATEAALERVPEVAD